MSKFMQPDMSKLRPIDSNSAMATPVMNQLPQESSKNGFLRCLIPSPLATDPDSLRQFYANSIPQYRITPPLRNGIRPGGS